MPVLTRHRHARVESFDVWNEVPLVPQLTGMSCWAAAAAMLVGWRDQLCVDPQALARGAGHWRAYVAGLLPTDVEALARSFDLAVAPGLARTPAGLRRQLERLGPLWVGEASPGLHAIVIVGIYSDGGPDNPDNPDHTFVRINDPWPLGRGERYVLTVSEFLKNFDAATDAVGAHAQVLHCKGRRSSAISTSSSSISSSISSSTGEPDIMDTFYSGTESRGLAAIAAGERYVDSSSFTPDPLAAHGGSGEKLLLRWNAMTDALEAIDLVVHFHGYTSSAPTRQTFELLVGRSGLELGSRKRPTLGLVIRGRKRTAAELARARQTNPKAHGGRYDFRGVASHRDKGAGLEQLLGQALSWFATNVLGRADAKLGLARLIFTGHSGGGEPINILCRHHGVRRACNPDEVQLFDATYGSQPGVRAWLAPRLAADRDASPHAGVRPDMDASGGGLRVFYRAGSSTAAGAKAIEKVLRRDTLLGRDAAVLAPWYRVETTAIAHGDVARRLGPIVLADPSAVLGAAAVSQGLVGGAPQRYGTPYGLFRRLAGPAASPTGLAADGAYDDWSADEVDELGAESRPDQPAKTAALQVPPAQARYAADARSPDLRHVQHAPGTSVAFNFGATELALLASANEFDLRANHDQPLIIFGLRGCQLTERSDGRFHATISMTQAVPDHRREACVIGVWDSSRNMIAAFNASTVPNERYMRRQMAAAAGLDDPLRSAPDLANMLLTGYHSFRVGRHRHVEGALIQGQPVVVLRSYDNLIYEVTDAYEAGWFGDNLHPSFEPHLRGATESFSSAGCQTVPGSATRAPNTRHLDPRNGGVGWATFRERLGLARNGATTAAGADANGRRYRMILLSGREAWMAANNRLTGYQRLRFGSSGPGVSALQRYLSSHPRRFLNVKARAGHMDAPTTLAWIAYQRDQTGTADGIVTPADAQAIGIPISGPAGAHHPDSSPDSSAQAWVAPFVDENSSQADQAQAVRLNVARSVGPAEGRYDSVHRDSQRWNFGIGSWTGSRVATVLEAHRTLATANNTTARLYAHFGGQPAFDAIVDRFRTQGTAAALSTAEQAMLVALGRDAQLRAAQDQQLAIDVRADLEVVGSQEPWYPYIDSYMNAISEIAAHVLVHARHQTGSAGFRSLLRQLVRDFGGEDELGKKMVAGTVTERHVLDKVRDIVVSRSDNREPDAAKRARKKQAVRDRYNTLFANHGNSKLGYYFNQP